MGWHILDILNAHSAHACTPHTHLWDDSAQRSLLKIYVARELEQDPEWVEEQLALLRDMLPELLGKLERLKASLVLQLVSDTAGVAAKLVRLKSLLPSTDVPALVARHVSVLERSHAAMSASMELLSLPGACREAADCTAHRSAALEDDAAAEALVAREPALLGADIAALLAEVRRLVPGQDAASFLAASPGAVLSMAQAGLESTTDGNLVPCDTPRRARDAADG